MNQSQTKENKENKDIGEGEGNISFRNLIKNTHSRFGVKLYTFVPKRINPQIQPHPDGVKQVQKQQTFKNQHQEKNKEQITVPKTPQGKKQAKQKRIRKTHTKEESESEEYHPSKRSKKSKKINKKIALKSNITKKTGSQLLF